MSAEQDLANAVVKMSDLTNEVQRFRDAVMGLSAIYPTVTEGRQAVADGKYFSVPGGGAYMRLYRRQGSSAELIAEFPDRAQVQSLVDTLGGRGVVGSSGDLMAKGAFGLGANDSYSPPNITDANVNLDAGLYRMRGDALGSFDTDPGFWAAVLAMTGQAGRSHAIGVEYVGSTGSRMHVGSRGSEGPFIWQRCVLFSDILGAVSQSGGVPTGAIIERGSNSNGEYVKFADGTLICFSRGTFPSGDFSPLGALFSTPSMNVSFPASFISNPVVSLGSSFGASGAWAGLGDSGTSNNGTSIRAYRASAVTAPNLRYEVIAIGRWY